LVVKPHLLFRQLKPDEDDIVIAGGDAGQRNFLLNLFLDGAAAAAIRKLDGAMKNLFRENSAIAPCNGDKEGEVLALARRGGSFRRIDAQDQVRHDRAVVIDIDAFTAD